MTNVPANTPPTVGLTTGFQWTPIGQHVQTIDYGGQPAVFIVLMSPAATMGTIWQPHEALAFGKKICAEAEQKASGLVAATADVLHQLPRDPHRPVA